MALVYLEPAMLMNGEISEDVVVNIADNKKMSINIVKKRASALGIKIIPKVDFQRTYDKYYKNKPKNADEFESVVVYLKPFNKDNLYDFLNPGAMQNVDKLPWQWNFGDSYDIFTEHNPTHTYTKAGTYTVTETVTNEAGQDMETKTNYITVTAPAETPTVVAPVPDFSASVTSGEAPLTVSFTDESSGSPNA